MARDERDNEYRGAHARGGGQPSSDAARQAARERLERRRAVAAPRQENHGMESAGLSVFISSLYEKAPSNARRHEAARRRFPSKLLIVAVIVLLALFLAVSSVVKACSGGTDSNEIVIEEIKVDWSKLPEDLDASVVKGLKAQESDPRIAEIANNAEAYALDGAERQAKLFKLAAEEPDAIDYVHDLPESYPAEKGEAYKEDVTKGEIPLLMQWDQRWGYTTYCGSFFGATGCCPTSLSMVYMGLTGKTDMTPYDMAQISIKNGFAVDDEGTVSSFLAFAAPELGLGCEEFYPSSDDLVSYLEQGYPVIVNVGEGDFTDGGHFIVATGLDENGKVIVNDPYSSVKSAKAWSAKKIANQSIGMYAFYEA